MDKFEPLSIDQVDFRIQSINKGGYATVLVYKDARVDMHTLNEKYGVGYWQRKHELINGQLFCSVGIWNLEIGQWCWIQDVGTMSNTEKEKGQASDSFKRACFNLGIGIELYDYPHMSIQLLQTEWRLNEQKKDKWGNAKPEATWNLKLKEWRWLSQFKDGKISFLAAKDQNGKMRFQWGEHEK